MATVHGEAARHRQAPESHDGTRLLGIVLGCCGIAMLPWLLVLANSLPAAESATWIGLDILEATGLAATGLLMLRRDPRGCLTATATAVLLVADAWFDVTTAAPGTELATAAAMALGVELPMAVLCTVAALRSWPHSARRGRR